MAQNGVTGSARSVELAPAGGEELEAIRQGLSVEAAAEVARAQAEIQVQAVLARRFPRDETRARTELAKAVKGAGFAEDAYYTFPRGKREIFGASINLAREFARRWGNIRWGFRAYDSADHRVRTIEAFAWDLETNNFATSQDTFARLHQRKNDAGDTEWVEPDERDWREVTERRGAIQVRNCILRLAPRDLIDGLVDDARQTIRRGEDEKPIEVRRTECLAAFEAMAIYAKDLGGYLGHALNEATPDELVELRGVWKSIRDGATSRDDYFGPRGAAREEEIKAPTAGGSIRLSEALEGQVVQEGEKEPKGAPKAESKAQAGPQKAKPPVKGGKQAAPTKQASGEASKGPEKPPKEKPPEVAPPREPGEDEDGWTKCEVEVSALEKRVRITRKLRETMDATTVARYLRTHLGVSSVELVKGPVLTAAYDIICSGASPGQAIVDGFWTEPEEAEE
jgi:hypothetical protein